MCSAFVCTTRISAQPLDSTATVLLTDNVNLLSLSPKEAQLIKPAIIAEAAEIKKLKNQGASFTTIKLVIDAYGDTIKRVVVQKRAKTHLKMLTKTHKLNGDIKAAVGDIATSEATDLLNIEVSPNPEEVKDSLRGAKESVYENKILAAIGSKFQWELAKKYGLTANLDSAATMNDLAVFNEKLAELQKNLITDPDNTAQMLFKMIMNPPPIIARLIISVRANQNGNDGGFSW